MDGRRREKDIEPRALHVCNTRDVVPAAPFTVPAAMPWPISLLRRYLQTFILRGLQLTPSPVSWAVVVGIVNCIGCLVLPCPPSSWPRRRKGQWWFVLWKTWRGMMRFLNWLTVSAFCRGHNTNREYFDSSVRLSLDSGLSTVARCSCIRVFQALSIRHNLEVGKPAIRAI